MTSAMTEKITRERIEHWRSFFSDVEPEDMIELNALCTLALQALVMQPRPNALVIQERGAWVAMLLDKDIMAQGATAEIAMERLHNVVSIEAEDADHFEALKPNPIAKLFYTSLPEPRR